MERLMRRFSWLHEHSPEDAMDATGQAMDFMGLSAEDRLKIGHDIMDDFNVPYDPIQTQPKETPKMTTKAKNTDLKSRDFIELHKLDEKITIDEKGIIQVPNDLHESIVLADAGISVEQHNKLLKGNDKLFAAVALVGGELTATAFKANPELSETSVSYGMGHGVTASVLFNRDGKDHIVGAVETRVKSSEFKRVVSHLNGLFDDINS